MTFHGDVITSAIFDSVQSNAEFGTDGAVATEAGEVLSKNQLVLYINFEEFSGLEALLGKVFSTGMMVPHTAGNGKMTKCAVKEHTLVPMELDILEHLRTISFGKDFVSFPMKPANIPLITKILRSII